MINIRKTEEKDFRITEEVTRKSFWNRFQPGANEHFILHNLRNSDDFVKELDLVIEEDDKIIGNIVYSKSFVEKKNGEKIETLTFGPVGILPEYQKKGYGAKLINYSTEKAKELGYKAVIIMGDPRFYHRVGFRCAEKYDITLPDGKFAVALLALELEKHILRDADGKFFESNSFEYDEKEFENFDKTFEPMEKGHSDFQDDMKFFATLMY